MNASELRAKVVAERTRILGPARAAAAAAERAIVQEHIGTTFGWTENGFSVGGYRIEGVTIDQYGNWWAREWPADPPPVELLEPLVIATLFLYDREGAHYPNRPAGHLLIEIARQFGKTLTREYVAEMRRLGDQHRERFGGGFSRWALGSAAGAGHLGGTPEQPQWVEWFEDSAEWARSRETAQQALRDGRRWY
jgi:hypothetical protein